MRNNADYSFTDGFGGSGAPIIAPVFATSPAPASYGAPVVGGGFGGFGGEGGILGLLAGAALLGGNGFGGRRDGGCDNAAVDSNLGTSIFGATVLGKLGDIQGAIPMAALQTQNAILEQTNDLNQIANANNISQLAASASVKDAVQNNASIALLNASNNTQAILTAVAGIGTKIDQNLISQLQTELAEQRGSSRSRDLEVNVNQTVVQAQAQQQQQAQLASLFGVVSNLANDLQSIRQNSVVFNSGTMAASGNQGAANTKVA